MAIALPERPDAEALQAILGPIAAELARALGAEPTIAVRFSPLRERPPTATATAWVHGEAVVDSSDAPDEGAAALQALSRVRDRVTWALARGTGGEALDVAEVVARERTYVAPRGGAARKGAERQWFVYRLAVREALERLRLRGNEWILFLDRDSGEFVALLRGPARERFVLLREEDADPERPRGAAPVSVALFSLDEEGTPGSRSEVRVPALPPGSTIEEVVALFKEGNEPLAAGREPSSGLPCVAWRDSLGQVVVADYLVRNEDVRLDAIEGFPPEELVPGPAARWEEALACPLCGGGLAREGEKAIRCGGCGRRFPVEGGVPILIPEGERPEPVAEEHAWAPNPVPKVLLYFLKKHPKGLVLDCGAGNSAIRAPNLVNLEIFRFPSTTVVASGERIPFRDGTIDAVLSAAVLEHVPDPFAYCAEIRRVLRRGGEARIDAAFLQPYHGCPDHYFATTASGLARAAAGLVPVAIGVGPHQAPFVALQTILHRYAQILGEGARRERFLDARVRDLLALPAGPGGPEVRIPPSDAHLLAAGVYFHGVKR